MSAAAGQNAPNADPAELAKFGRLAARWWDPNSEFKPLHDINPLRLEWIAARCGAAGPADRNGLANQNVLDVGCGGGLLSEAMAAQGARVTGIDLGAAPLAVARLHLLESGLQVDYRCESAEGHALTHAGRYDVVTCLEMLEHVPDPASVVAACARLVRPGGQVFFSTLNRTPKSFFFAIVGAEYVLGLLPRGTHEFRKFIRPSELARACRTAGLHVDEYTGMHYHPVRGIYTLGPGLDVNYLVCCHRP